MLHSPIYIESITELHRTEVESLKTRHRVEVERLENELGLLERNLTSELRSMQEESKVLHNEL